MNEQQLIEEFQQLIHEIESLDEWNFSNANKLDRLNKKRYALTDFLMELGLETPMSIAYGTDETNRDIAIALETRPKKKGDIPFYEGKYYQGIRNLMHEIKSYVAILEDALNKKS